MSQKRQTIVFDRLRDRDSGIISRSQDYPAGHVVPLHFHDRDQVVFASRGVMTVRTGDGTWVVPPHRAVWIPATVAHTITMSGRVAMRTLYLKPQLAKDLPRACCVINVSPLLRELILHVCTIGSLKKRTTRHKHLIDVVVDQLQAVQMVPLQLPHLSDARAIRITKALLADPSDARTLSQLCRVAGASKRTIERLFQEEAGITLGKWRQQLRLMQAVRLLAEGAKVTHAALDSGYSTPSAFISMFKKTLGTTPTLYFKTAARNSPLPSSAENSFWDHHSRSGL